MARDSIGLHIDKFDWRGPEVATKVRRAMGRAVVAIAENIVVDAKQNAHVVTGTLRRSIHSAPVNYNGHPDTEQASDVKHGGRQQEVANAGVEKVTYQGERAVLQVGSWLAYACVEEVGRGHRFLGPAVEQARTYSPQIIRRALAEEGLNRG